MQQYDVGIVGAGIVGLAHAWMAAARGLKVILWERSTVASGASIRNFGMVWPIGQPAGEMYSLALRSRELWLRLSIEAGVWVNHCGSLHLAHRPDEMAVLQEFVDLPSASQFNVKLLTPAETFRRSPGARPEGLLGAMWSPSELCVNPAVVIARIPRWLQEHLPVSYEPACNIMNLDGNTVLASDGRRWHAKRIVICSGIDFQTLLPATFAEFDLKKCKLQMMSTLPQANNWRIGPHLASGLTLRHYTSFAECPSLPLLKARVQSESPELDTYGIHVMASQNELGQVILGDSHEYDEQISPFDRTEIEQLILRELSKQFVLPDWTIHKRWHGNYAKCPDRPILEATPRPQVHVCVAPGGAGMTLSFGIADRFWRAITGQELQ